METPQPELSGRLAHDLKISPLLAQCLINRGLDTPQDAAQFMNPRLAGLADPFELPNMQKAVDRLFAARVNNEALTIFGDYDVDGVTSTALLTLSLRELGWEVHPFLPHRMEEGFGLSRAAVEKCLEVERTPLLLAVDCGSTNAETIDWLNSEGIDVLVLDHHQLEGEPPRAHALVNPQVASSGEPDFRELCSAGLAFKLLHAVVKQGRREGFPEMEGFDLKPFLDLVALGTIADLVPLRRENRILARAGLEWLNRTRREGLLALKEVSQSPAEIGVYEVGFHLGPRLNAAGRLESAKASLDLLLTDNAVEAERISALLDEQNRERQAKEREIADEVISAVRGRFDPEKDFVIVEGRSHWHLGVVGIVASRVMREFYRPAIVLGGDGEAMRGSGRSIEGIDLVAALRECDDLLTTHGGHAMAAGVGLKPENVDEFRERLNAFVKEKMTGEMLSPPLRLDAETNLYDLTIARVNELQRLQPTGQENPSVQLIIRDLELDRPPYRMGREKQHAKLWVRDDGAQTLEAVMWNVAEGQEPEGRFDLAVAPQINEYNGRRSVQLKVLDWRHASTVVGT